MGTERCVAERGGRSNSGDHGRRSTACWVCEDHLSLCGGHETTTCWRAKHQDVCKVGFLQQQVSGHSALVWSRRAAFELSTLT